MATQHHQAQAAQACAPAQTPEQTQSWWEELQAALASGKHCLGLTFNVDDYVFLSATAPKPLLAHLQQHFAALRYDLILTYTISRGLELYEPNAQKESQLRRYAGLSLTPADQTGQAAPSPSVILRGLDRLLRQDTLRVAFILPYGHDIAPVVQGGLASVLSEDQLTCVELLHTWSLDTFLNTKTENTVIALLREGHYHDLLAEHWKIIRLDLPNSSDLSRFYLMLGNLHAQGRREFAPLEPTITVDEAARASCGLRLRTVEEMNRRAAVRQETVSLQLIREEKAKEVKRLCDELLEVLETNLTFNDLAGLAYVKDFYRQIIQQVKRGFRNIPRALLLVGPPGCGKSFQVRALANELNWNCLMMRALRSMWVGESERNLERVLNAVQALTPCILFIDEVDQMLGQRGQGGDAGTSERILARLWEFMALEHLRGRLIFVAATNRPDLLDPASVDRFSTVIPILHPTTEELQAVLPRIAQQIGYRFAADIELQRAAALLRQKELSTRQVVDVVSMAALHNDQLAAPGSPITEEALLAAARSFRNNHHPLELELIVLQAVRMTTFNELLPWTTMPERYEYPPYLRRLLDENQALNPAALAHRLSELQQQLLLQRAGG